MVVKTTNAGTNWAAMTSGTSVELRSVHFMNSLTGLACGYNGTIIRTTNSGLNWNSVSSGSSNHLLGTSFVNDAIGIIGGNSGTMLYNKWRLELDCWPA
jgi:photosystem II stability/assembly factor-like uncharacterized protein